MCISAQLYDSLVNYSTLETRELHGDGGGGGIGWGRVVAKLV